MYEQLGRPASAMTGRDDDRGETLTATVETADNDRGAAEGEMVIR